MTQQQAKPGIRALEALALAIFLATAAFLMALLVTWIGKGVGTFQAVGLLVSTACAVVAAFGMLWDAIDLWVRGRKMSFANLRRLRILVFVAVLGALAASMLGRNTALVVYLMPAMITYLFVARRRPNDSYAASPAGARGGAARPRGNRPNGASSSSRYKARQRRGGKKHR